MNKTKIDWPGLDYTWNPVVGCKRGCEYCYAKRMNDRFKWVDDFSKIVFFENRLTQPFKVKKPAKIFVGSMSDICYWKSEDAERVLNITRLLRNHHTFMFLTKEPDVYFKYNFPENCILGTTVTCNSDKLRVDTLYEFTNQNRTFVSIEPIIGDCSEICFIGIDTLIIGAMTGPGAVEPKKEWIESIKHPNIHYKANIKKYL